MAPDFRGAFVAYEPSGFRWEVTSYFRDAGAGASALETSSPVPRVAAMISSVVHLLIVRLIVRLYIS